MRELSDSHPVRPSDRLHSEGATVPMTPAGRWYSSEDTRWIAEAAERIWQASEAGRRRAEPDSVIPVFVVIALLGGFALGILLLLLFP